MPLFRNVTRLPRMPPCRSFASDPAPPLMWKLAHGMFDAETSMVEKYPGIPEPTAVTATAPSAPESTTLPNGVRVVSQDLGGPVSSVALFVGAGSRNEMPYSSGVSHILERLAFKGSKQRSKYRMVRDMERTGAIFNAMASRETMAYAAEGLRKNVPDFLSIVTETALHPACAMAENDDSMEWDTALDEISLQGRALKADLENFEKDSNAVVTEAIHAVAFRGNTLGLPLVPNKDKLDQLNPMVVNDFISTNYTPSRLVVAAANYEHVELVELVHKMTRDVSKTNEAEIEQARYTGGGNQISGVGPAVVSMGFKSVSWRDPDLVPICVLHSMLGGGGSFSSGGPGKGMYTRLYSRILNQHGWVTSAMAYNHCYSDSGLFGIQASCEDSSQINDLIAVVGLQIGEMGLAPARGELERAKAMTKSSLIMNLETRAIVCEDLGRQILCSGKYTGPAELVKQIEAVTADDLRRVVVRMIESTASIVTYGEEYGTQDYKAIEMSLKSNIGVTG